MTTGAERLLAPLTDEQQALVDAIAEVLAQHDVWPSVHYLERKLAIPAVTPLVASFPSLGAVHYSAVWAMSSGGVHMAENDVGLTVAGLAHVRGGERFIGPFLAMLRGVARQLDELPMDPKNVPTLTMNLGDLARCVRLEPGDARLADVEAVVRLIPHEPSTWHGNLQGEREELVWSNVPWHISRFRDVETVEAYLAELEAFVGPPRSMSALAAEPVPHADAAAPDWATLLHPRLREHVEPAITGARWDTLIREASAFLEHELRTRATFGTELSGVDLAKEALKPGGPLAMPPAGHPSEQEGWHLLTRGFVQAVRNPFGPRPAGRDSRDGRRRVLHGLTYRLRARQLPAGACDRMTSRDDNLRNSPGRYGRFVDGYELRGE